MFVLATVGHEISDRFKVPFTTTSDFFFFAGILLGVYAKYLNPMGFDLEEVYGGGGAADSRSQYVSDALDLEPKR